MTTIKQEAINLINNIPDNENLTWDDIMYEIYVRQKVELGLKAIDEGKLISHEEMKKRFSPK